MAFLKFYMMSLLSIQFGTCNRTLKTDSDTCPSGWLDGIEEGVGCLWIKSNSQLSWMDALTYCHEKHEARLVVIENDDQLDFIKNHLRSGVYWTAGSDLGSEGNWQWIGGDAPVEDFIWESDQPNGEFTQNCLRISSSGKGDDRECDEMKYSICQKSEAVMKGMSVKILLFALFCFG